jgi:CheB methylesterase
MPRRKKQAFRARKLPVEAEPTLKPRREDPSPDGPRFPRPFPIVGIGGSAGSLSALRELFAEFPADCPLRFVVISHGDPKGPTLLPEILARDGSVVGPGTIHVAPAGRHLSIQDGVLRLGEPVERGSGSWASDAGVGFAPDEITPGLGLLNARERLEQLGGCLEVRSRRGEGTWVRAQLPLSIGAHRIAEIQP